MRQTGQESETDKQRGEESETDIEDRGGEDGGWGGEGYSQTKDLRGEPHY